MAFPDVATLETTLDLAGRAPSAGNSQPWRWQVDGDGIHLYAERHRQLGDTDADWRDVLLGCGAVLDHCVIALEAQGWRTRLHRFPGGGRHHLALLEVIEAPAASPSRELADLIPRRRADRRPYGGDPLEAGTLELLAVRADRRDVVFGVVPARRWARDGDDVVLRYGSGEGAADGVLLVLGTQTDDDAARLRAGEVMSRMLLSATALDLASCPITEPLKQTRDRLALAAEVFDGDAYPQVLIRLGQAPAEPLPAVERLSVAETTTWALASPRG